MVATKAPSRIAVGVRVQEIAKAKRTGTVNGKFGQTRWIVVFDGETKEEKKTSAQLRIHQDSYGKQTKTPERRTRTVIAEQPKTGRPPRRAATGGAVYREEDSQEGESFEVDISGIVNNSSEQSVEASADYSNGSKASFSHGSSREDSSLESKSKDKSFFASITQSAKKYFSRKGKEGMAKPKPRKLDDRFSVLTFSHINSFDEVFVQEEGEGFNDYLEFKEDDPGLGEPKVLGGCGGEVDGRVDFIDEPQKNALYQAAKAKMEKERAMLVKNEHKVKVKVKPIKSFEVMGRVEGKKNTDLEGHRGTIEEVLGKGKTMRFQVKWCVVLSSLVINYVISCARTYQLHNYNSSRDDDSELVVERKQVIQSKEPDTQFVWKVVDDHVPKKSPSTYSSHGVVGFDPDVFCDIDPSSPGYQHPFGRLLMELWPGNWREQLKAMNLAIATYNQTIDERKRIKEVTEKDWWNIWGIIILAGKAGVGGLEKLYSKPHSVLPELPAINLSKIMPQHRARQLLKWFPRAFHGTDITDPWYPVAKLVEGFNNNRAQKIAASFTKVLDETMSPWSPTTTKTGGLPFLSFILRKPKPLGTEFKTVADTETGELNTLI